jgi:ABC-2 type transport system permease protein
VMASLGRIFLLEALLEWRRLLRMPAFSITTALLPILAYLSFGITLGKLNADPAFGRELLARFTVFGIMAPALFGFGLTVALDRDRGLLKLKRALPMPPGVYLSAKLAMAMIFACIISATMMLIAATLGHVRLQPVQWLAEFIVAVVGVIPFCGLGLLIGASTRTQAASAVTNLIYVPMSFLSGLLIPLSILPSSLGHVAPALPAFHLAQLALAAVGAAEVPRPGLHILILCVMSAAFFAIALRQFRKLDDQQMLRR